MNAFYNGYEEITHYCDLKKFRKENDLKGRKIRSIWVATIHNPEFVNEKNTSIKYTKQLCASSWYDGAILDKEWSKRFGSNYYYIEHPIGHVAVVLED